MRRGLKKYLVVATERKTSDFLYYSFGLFVPLKVYSKYGCHYNRNCKVDNSSRKRF